MEVFLAIYATAVMIASLAVLYVSFPKKLGVVLAGIEIEKGLIEEMRLLAADLGSRDPQLTEHMELVALRLDGWERDLRVNERALLRAGRLGLVRRPKGGAS